MIAIFIHLGRAHYEVAGVAGGAAPARAARARGVLEHEKMDVMGEFVRIHEVGPRDGLQNEPGVISVARKVALIDLLGQSGLRDIEVGSFVSPRWVPQMADTDQVLAQIPAVAGVRYAVLVPNMRGWEGFLRACRTDMVTEIAVFISASEGFSQSNLNCSIADSIARLRPVVNAAYAQGIGVRGYVSCVTDCPFDGPTDPTQVADTVGFLRDIAQMPVSLGDTIGKATPKRTAAMLDAVLGVVPVTALAGHFHDTEGRASANVETALEMGVRAFDTAVGGLGGCPYAPGAPGNVATEVVLALLQRLGYQTGVDLEVIAQAAQMAKGMR